MQGSEFLLLGLQKKNRIALTSQTASLYVNKRTNLWLYHRNSRHSRKGAEVLSQACLVEGYGEGIQ